MRPDNKTIQEFADQLKRFEWGELEWAELRRRTNNVKPSESYMENWCDLASLAKVAKAFNIQIDPVEQKRINEISEQIFVEMRGELK